MANTFVPAAGQAPTSNADAVCTMAAPTDNSRWKIYQIVYSYSGTPTGGKITIVYGTVTFTFYVLAGGPGVLTFGSPLVFPPNTQVVVTLVAGGSGISGTVYPEALTSV